LARLESEEKVILNAMAAREQEMGVVEKAISDLFAGIGADITAVKKKVEEVTVESAVVQPVPPVEPVVAQPVPPVERTAAQPIQPVEHAPAPVPPRDPLKSDIPSATEAGVEQKSEIQESAPPQDTEFQKKCPMCGGRMDLQMNGEMWICYTCAFEEPGKGEVPGKSEVKREQRNAPETTPPGAPAVGVAQKSEILESAAPQDTELQKKCPMCGGRMDFNISGEMWMCYTCAYEEPGAGEVQGKSEAKREQRRAPAPAPSPSLPPTKTKSCPACGKKMGFHENDKAWRCPHCEYERRI
jgi:ribosomal protein L37AE/L43A